MIAKLPLVPFVIISLTRLTAGVCMHESEIQVQGNQRFFFYRRFASRLRRFAALSQLKKNFWDLGNKSIATSINWRLVTTKMMECSALKINGSDKLN